MRTTTLFLAVTTMAAMSSLSSAAELKEGQVSIELRPQFVARKAEVRLGDIAILHTTDLATIQRLSALPVGNAPLVGADAPKSFHCLAISSCPRGRSN